MIGAFGGAIVSWFLIGNMNSLKAGEYKSTLKVPEISVPYIAATINSDSGNIYPNCDWDLAEEIKTAGIVTGYIYKCSTAGWVFAAMLTEVVGSFFFCFFFLT